MIDRQSVITLVALREKDIKKIMKENLEVAPSVALLLRGAAYFT